MTGTPTPGTDQGRLPLIGVTGSRFAEGAALRYAESVAVPAAYCDAVALAGGLPVVLTPRPHQPTDAPAVVASLDGLLLTGGPDVVPRRYGQEPRPEVYGASELQDDFEAALLHAALEAGTPVLCICRGAQLLNVEKGGTLHQHITGAPGFGPHGVPAGGGASRNRIRLEPDSLAAAVVGATTIEGNCHHHQAIDRVGSGLAVTGRTEDGVVEVLEADAEISSWLLAVQWHPEETAASDPANLALFQHLVRAALS